jgi:fermentation-respiration switch protein FrsA (DUF1100 family)
MPSRLVQVTLVLVMLKHSRGIRINLSPVILMAYSDHIQSAVMSTLKDHQSTLQIDSHVLSYFFKGWEDQVVPPNQAEKMVEAIKSKRIPVSYVPFAGEQHGFRQAQNIKRSLDAGALLFFASLWI